MERLRRLGFAVVLTLGLFLTAFAGDTQTPPCVTPEPGDTQTPPCAVQVAQDQSQVSTYTSNSVDIYPIVDAALDSLRSVLSVY